MKKILSLVLVLSMMISSISFFSVEPLAAMPSPSVIDGYSNVCLTYTYRPDLSNYGHFERSLMPYVAYLDSNGNIKDFFFDSFLFLPCMTNAPSGARMHVDFDNPTIASDWVHYVDDTFNKDMNVDALDSAFGKTKAALNSPDKKAGVFLTILYPAYTSTDFGTLGGRNLDFSKKADRQYAIKWIIDEQLQRFNNAGYSNLDLVGFYWLEEVIYTEHDAEMMQYASEYLHSLGLKFIWIPFYKATGYSSWDNYGFDLACLQPNMYWMQTADYSRVDNCARECKQYGMSMQMEVGLNVCYEEYYNRYLAYLKGGLNSGAMNSVKFYYQEAKPAVFYTSCYSEDPKVRAVYDLTYKYAKGTLTSMDLDYGLASGFKLPKNVDWVSIGKSYTGCESYTDGNGMLYQDVSGTELTDGEFGMSVDGTEWHAYHNSLVDSEGRMSSVIDLGEVRTDLTHFMAHFHNYEIFGIGVPTDVKFYTSTDGINFELLATPSVIENNLYSYVEYVSSTKVTARYIKMSTLNDKGNFVFCSEILAGAYNSTLDSEPDAPQDPSEGDSDDSLNHTHTPDKEWHSNSASHWHVCECGKVIDNDAHTSGDWTIVVSPTTKEEGIQQKRCKVCNKLLVTASIPKLDYDYGDVNKNNEIDALDYVLVKRHYFGMYDFDATEFTLADVNQNGTIETLDYILIKRMYFGTYEI